MAGLLDTMLRISMANQQMQFQKDERLARQQFQQDQLAQITQQEAAQQSAAGERQALDLSSQLQLAGVDTRSMPGIGQRLASEGGAGVAQSILQNPAVSPGAAAQSQRDAALFQQELVAKQLANQKNAASLARQGLTADKFGEINLQGRTLTRGLATMQELDELSRSPNQLIKGGAAAKAKYLARTLQPAIMEMINTGVINSPAEMERVDSFIATIGGWAGATTWTETQQAQLQEMRRWFTNKANDLALSYQLDPAAWNDAYRPRTIDELNAEINALDIDQPTPPPPGFEPISNLIDDFAESERTVGEELGKALSGGAF